MKKFITSAAAVIMLIATINIAFSIMDMGLGTLSLQDTKASSYLSEKGKPADYYSPARAFDRKPETAWCRGKDDGEKDAFIEAKFKPYYTDSIYIINGYGANKSLYYANNRIRDYEVTVTFKDGKTLVKKGRLGENGCLRDFSSDPESNYKCRWSVDPDYDDQPEKLVDFGQGKPRCVTGLKLKIISVYPGKKYTDTCVAEIGPVFNAGWVYDEDNYVEKCRACCDDCCAVE